MESGITTPPKIRRVAENDYDIGKTLQSLVQIKELSMAAHNKCDIVIHIVIFYPVLPGSKLRQFYDVFVFSDDMKHK